MAKSKHTAMISLDGSLGDVVFEGVWTRRLVDIAHGQMVRALPKHILEMKTKVSEPKKEKNNASSK